MPTPDWMCRSELILPKLKQLLSDPRFEVRPVTLGEYLLSVESGTGVPPVVSPTVPVGAQSTHEDVRSTGVPPVVSATVPVEGQKVERRQGANLPHWTTEGGTYAVTFRLADALPRAAQEEYKAERLRLKELKDRGQLDSLKLAYEYQRLYAERIEHTLDVGLGSCLLRDPVAAKIVVAALEHFDGSRYRLHAWCIMPNHVHAVVEPLADATLSKVLHSWKSFTSHEINRALNRTGDVWLDESYDHLVRNELDYDRQVAYVWDNPSKAGIGPWPWRWSAKHDRDGRENHGRDAHATLPVRSYTMDQVWHGMTLGKNGDRMRRMSREAEASLLSAETLAAIAGLFGRPYAQWDVYPTWELEEAWRELLSAQHHDNDECEGLCGHVGWFSYEKSKRLSRHSGRFCMRQIIENLGGKRPNDVSFNWGRLAFHEDIDGTPGIIEKRGHRTDRLIFLNSLGWARKEKYPWLSPVYTTQQEIEIPPFGYAVVEVEKPLLLETYKEEQDRNLRAIGRLPTEIVHGDLHVERDTARGSITQIKSKEFPEGALAGAGAFGLVLQREGTETQFEVARMRRKEGEAAASPYKHDDQSLQSHIAPNPVTRAIDLRYSGRVRQPDPGMNASLQIVFQLSFDAKIYADFPYGVAEATPIDKGLKKYPTGDWMTSSQWFEEVRRPFTSLSFVDFMDVQNPDRGLLIVHDGSQQWLVHDDGSIRCILTAYDPWDEDYFVDAIGASFHLMPHGPMSNSERWKTAQQFLRPPMFSVFDGEPKGPSNFSAVSCDAENVALTAFYRETRDSAKGQQFHAVDVLGVDYPYVLRLLELDGLETATTLTFGATVAGAWKTNLLGEPEEDLTESVQGGTSLPLRLRPYEIATIYLDLVEGRKQVRDLDARREVWATVHRVDG